MNSGLLKRLLKNATHTQSTDWHSSLPFLSVSLTVRIKGYGRPRSVTLKVWSQDQRFRLTGDCVRNADTQARHPVYRVKNSGMRPRDLWGFFVVVVVVVVLKV